jgi:hypothetical protein
MMFAWSPGVLGYACEWLTPRAHRVQAVEGKERDLRERGAAWDPPSVSTMLRSLPFLADTSETLFEEVMLQGHMVKYQKGAVIAPAGGKAACHSEPPQPLHPTLFCRRACMVAQAAQSGWRRTARRS